jgi:glycerophosphoryl diester phosphodiesterase
MRQWLQDTAIKTVDFATAIIPQAAPKALALRNCKVIAHRGEHDNTRLIENTMPAFASARAAGVWGIECDIRWTADLVPIIHHDATCQRLFGDPVSLATLSCAQIRERFPLIPTLAEVVAELGGHTHLMLEIKADHYPQEQQQKAILRDLLRTLAPGKDYHFLLLDPVLATHVDFLPREFCFLVAQLNVSQLSRHSLQHGFGGLTGHFLLLNDQLKRRHAAEGQRIGTGFIGSRNTLFRELNRGIEWIFSNDAVKIQKIRDRYLER